ncbi:MAG: peptide deformylase [Nitrospinae bacterium]|nr:peptide deformylase [Nitrospinota bacterium]
MNMPQQDGGDPRLLPIVIWPDPVLTVKAAPVETIDDKVRDLSEKMIYTLSVTSNGVGLAAPQVGVSLRMAAFDPSYDPDDIEGLADPDALFMAINPEIVEEEGSYLDEEGCLSLPDLFYPVERPERVTMRYITLDGEPRTLVAHDFMAKLICHEIDHLDGILLWDRLSRFKREWLKGKFKKMRRR